MNEKFFALPKEKQEAIINGGFRVFSENSYKKSPMSEIAFCAGISKSLLFHYFVNKKELYLFLWKKSADITFRYLKDYGCYENTDIFEAMKRGLMAKLQIMREYPDLSNFALKAFYEKDPEVCKELQESIAEYSSFSRNTKNIKMDPKDFKEGLDLQLMYQDMYWSSAGYIWEKQQTGGISADEMEKDYMKLIDFWKSLYLRNEG